MAFLGTSFEDDVSEVDLRHKRLVTDEHYRHH